MAAERLVRPDDPSLLYDQYFELSKTGERASFSRCYDPRFGCDLPESLGFGREWHYHPGARVTLLTDATRVRVALEYVTACQAACAGTPPDHCYHPHPDCGERRFHFMCGECTNHCAPSLYVDGVLQELASTQAEFSEGTHDVLLMELDDTGPRRERRLELVMPWGGEVQIHGFRLCCGTPPLLRKPTRSSTFSFVAYGDSIVQGYCSGGTPFPEVLGRLNNWSSLNLGIGGMRTSPQHGVSLGRVHADLVLMAIGTNDWWHSCDVSNGIGGTIDGLRSIKPTLPLVVMTMLARGDEPNRSPRHCIVLEDFRQQIREEVERRRRGGDQRLYLIEGKPLLSLSRFGDGLHPGSVAAATELAHNLNAQMGFSAVQYSIACDVHTSTLQVRMNGLTRGAECALHWGTTLENVVMNSPCETRSIMVGGHGGKRTGRADESGSASFAVQEVDCAATLFQAVDLATCSVSRVGSASDLSSISGSAAESFERLATALPPKGLQSPSPSPPTIKLSPPPPRPIMTLPSSPPPPTARSAQPPVLPPPPPPSPTPSPPQPSLSPPPPRPPPTPPPPTPPQHHASGNSFGEISPGTARFSLAGAPKDVALLAVGFLVPALLLWAKRACWKAERAHRSRSHRKYASLPTLSDDKLKKKKKKKGRRTDDV